MKPPFPDFAPNDEPEDRSRLESLPPPHIVDDDPDAAKPSQRSVRLRDIPFRMLVPSLITLLAICAGLTAVRLSLEGRYELALAAIVFAAFLDALDGRVARFLKASTSFGEQLDSLADFVNFGVAPALILYSWSLSELFTMGWIVALVFAICGCLRLARFNVMLEEPNKPDWAVNFFTGVPAPAGALLSLLPIYATLMFNEGLLLADERKFISPWLVAAYVLGVGLLMVSTIPTLSLKKAGQSIGRAWVLPVVLAFVLFVVLFFSYPWGMLTICSLLYLAVLPYGVWRHRRYAKG